MVAGGQTYYAAQDAAGNVIGMIDRNFMSAKDTYRYQPFGTMDQNDQNVPTSLRWKGLLYDAESGRYYVRARYYAPEMRRFLSEDPIGLAGGINPYTFAGNDPVNGADPSGECPQFTQCIAPYAIAVHEGCDPYLQGPYICPVSDPFSWAHGWAWQSFRGSRQEPTSRGSVSTPAAPNNFIRMPLPSNAQACRASTGINFNAPPGFSVNDIAADGRANGLLGAGAAVGQGEYYDFQRSKVGVTTQFFPGYTPVANIAVGAYLSGAVGSPRLGSLISNTYASIFSSNGATAHQETFRNLGFSLASGKAKYSCQPHP